MVYRATPKTAARKDARRRKFVETALSLFGVRGYHATTVPAIVADSGASTGSFYAHFRDKEDIFAAVLEALAGRIAEELNRAVEAAGPDVAAQMRAAVEAFVLFLARNPAEARILLVESSGLGERLEKVRRDVVASHARSVEEALESLGVANAPIAARCWTGAVYEAAFAWLEAPPGDRPPAEELAATVAAFNLRAVGR